MKVLKSKRSITSKVDSNINGDIIPIYNINTKEEIGNALVTNSIIDFFAKMDDIYIPEDINFVCTRNTSKVYRINKDREITLTEKKDCRPLSNK